MGRYYKKLAYIVLISVALKLLLMPLFLEDKPPYLPYFDMVGYVNEGKCILGHGILYSGNTLKDVCFSLHGPSFPILMAIALKILGESYLLKLPAILFDALSAVVFFHIGKILLGGRISLFITFAYAFSYISLYLSGMTGNDDIFFMFFVLLATFLLFRGNSLLSAASLAIAASFKVAPLLFLPAFFIAIYSKSGFKKALGFMVVFGVTLSAILMPFYLDAGSKMLVFYMGNAAPSVTGQIPSHLSFLNLLRMSDRIFWYVLDPSVSNQDLFVDYLNRRVVPVLSTLGLLFAGVYVLLNRVRKTDLEFLRNCTVIVISALLTSSLATPDYILWFLPFLYLLFGVVYTKRYNKEGFLVEEYAGAILTLFGIFSYALFFKFSYYEIVANTYFVWFVFILSPIGTYLMFFRIPKRDRLLLAGVILAISMYGVIGTNPFLVFKPVAEKILPHSLAMKEVVVVSESGGTVRSPLLVDILYLPYLFISILVFLISASLLVWRVHRLGKIHDEVKK